MSRPDPGPAIPPPAPGGVRVGPWRLVEALGPGTFAAVDTATGADVVVKLADPTPAAASRARREAAARLVLGGGDHPALVATAGTHDDGSTVAVASHWVPGAPLDRVVAGAGPLPPAVAARVVAPVADALAWIHARGWVHGDVSAANIVVGPAGAVLVDLGSARPVAPRSLRDHVEATPAAAAPEVLAGEAPTPASDVWSLAAVLRDVAGLGAGLAAALDRDPDRRPSAAELARQLTELGATAADVPLRTARRTAPRAERSTVDLGARPRPPEHRARTVPAWPFAAAGGVAATAAVLAGWLGG